MENFTLQFAQPLWLLAGLVACLVAWALGRRYEKKRQSDLSQIIHHRFHRKLTFGDAPQLRKWKRVLWIIALAAFFIAAARPQYGADWQQVKRQGIDILFALDTSRSMLAEDLSPNRLELARMGILDFIDRLDGDRVGIIPFAGSAFALSPLTLDYDAFKQSLAAIDTNIIPKQGTDLASAIEEAEQLFEQEKNNHRLLVLLTDGEDLQGSAIEAAEKAAKNGTIIYTVGVGSTEASTIPIRDRYGRVQILRDDQGNVVKSRLDESTLKKIAEVSNGLYVPLGRGAAGLKQIYEQRLRLVPKDEFSQRTERIAREQYQWPLGFGVLMIFAQFLLPDHRRKLPTKAVLATAVLMLCAMPQHLFATTADQDPRISYNQGTKAYHDGEFETAVSTFENTLRTDDLEIQQKTYYNLGNTHFRLGQAAQQSDPKKTIAQWEKAVASYKRSLELRPDDADAKFNHEFVQAELEKLKQTQNPEDSPKDQDKKDQEKKDSPEKSESSDSSNKPEDQKDKSKEQKKSNQENSSKDQSKPQQEEGEQSKKDGEQAKQDGEQAKQDGEQAKQDGEQAKQDGEQAKQDGQQAGTSEGQSPGTEKEGDQVQVMTAAEAKQLLDSLQPEQGTVIPWQRRQSRDPNMQRAQRQEEGNGTGGKTW